MKKLFITTVFVLCASLIFAQTRSSFSSVYGMGETDKFFQPSVSYIGGTAPFVCHLVIYFTPQAGGGPVSYIDTTYHLSQRTQTNLYACYPPVSGTYFVNMDSHDSAGLTDGPQTLSAGAFSVSTGIENVSQTTSTLWYSTGSLGYTNIPERSTLCLINLLGQSVLASTIESQDGSLSTRDLPAGIYIASIRNGDQTILTKKIRIE